MKKRGFTLTEVLGVIVILGLIALIIFPNINKSIKNSKQKLYNQQITLIEENARKWGVEHTAELPDSGSYYLELNDLVLGGYISQKELKDPRDDSAMNGCVVISYDSAYNQYKYEYTEVSCADQKEPEEVPPTIIDPTEKPGENGTITTDPDGNKRFAGSNPDNYVEFGTDLYRIIGTFNGQMKIIYWGPKSSPGEFYTNANIEFDPNSSGGGHGEYGYNDWNQAKLKITLNSTYWNTISSTYQAMVDQNHVWNIGGTPNDSTVTRSEFYAAERSTTISSVMSSATWTGKVGLMYPSDYGYATSSTNSTCNSVAMLYWSSGSNQGVSSECYSTSYNWLANTSYYQWTMTPWTSSEYTVFYVDTSGSVDNASTSYNNIRVRPVVYLKSDVKITGGEGTEASPYILSQ